MTIHTTTDWLAPPRDRHLRLRLSNGSSRAVEFAATQATFEAEFLRAAADMCRTDGTCWALHVFDDGLWIGIESVERAMLRRGRTWDEVRSVEGRWEAACRTHDHSQALASGITRFLLCHACPTPEN